MNGDALNRLCDEGRLRRLSPSAGAARSIWDGIGTDLRSAALLLGQKGELQDTGRAHECAYDAVFKGVVAILRCLGFRLGAMEQRVAAVQALRAILDDPGHAGLMTDFDRMREKRNSVAYEGGKTTILEAKEAIETAHSLLNLLRPVYEQELARTFRGDRGPGPKEGGRR